MRSYAEKQGTGISKDRYPSSHANAEAVQFKDNRPESHTHIKIQGIANEVVQRKVLLRGEQYTPGDAERQHLSPKARNWIDDPWPRNYDSREEFMAHVEGRPVQVGLSKRAGLWYRLPFPSVHAVEPPRFFVLGENHNAVSYRDILTESNQTGNILGESGVKTNSTNPFEENPDSPLHQVPQATAAQHVAVAVPALKEHRFEGQVAKGYYAIMSVLKNNKFDPKKGAAQEQYGGTGAQWEREAVAKGIKRTTGGVVKIDEEGGKPYPENTAAAGHTHGGAVIRTIDKLLIDIQKYRPSSKLVTFLTYAKALVEDGWGELHNLSIIRNRLENNTELFRIMDEEFYGAHPPQREPPEFDLGNRREMIDRENQQRRQTESKKAQIIPSQSFRDRHFVKAILEANRAGNFVMAGIGYDHLATIIPVLEHHGIKFISYDYFVHGPFRVQPQA